MCRANQSAAQHSHQLPASRRLLAADATVGRAIALSLMETYLQRYLRPEYSERLNVWAELVATIREEPAYSDAQAVAREMMQRAKHNIALLHSRLTELGYRFIRPEDAWRQPNAKHQVG